MEHDRLKSTMLNPGKIPSIFSDVKNQASPLHTSNTVTEEINMSEIETSWKKHSEESISGKEFKFELIQKIVPEVPSCKICKEPAKLPFSTKVPEFNVDFSYAISVTMKNVDINPSLPKFLCGGCYETIAKFFKLTNDYDTEVLDLAYRVERPAIQEEEVVSATSSEIVSETKQKENVEIKELLYCEFNNTLQEPEETTYDDLKDLEVKIDKNLPGAVF